MKLQLHLRSECNEIGEEKEKEKRCSRRSPQPGAAHSGGRPGGPAEAGKVSKARRSGPGGQAAQLAVGPAAAGRPRWPEGPGRRVEVAGWAIWRFGPCWAGPR